MRPSLSTAALKAFQPLCSELVVCIAQGGRPDDGTRAIVEKSGAKVVEYHNGPAGASWPHIDNFAAARNTALDACTGDYAVWVDCDDLPAKDLKNALKRAVERRLNQIPRSGSMRAYIT
jgi:glycosyltransferase involved in cell wall biosynthesis